MKKIIFAICMFVSLVLTSCSDIYAQSVTVSENGISYEYVYNDCPVVLQNRVFYYYSLYNGSYAWRQIPRMYHNNIIHLHEPRLFYYQDRLPRPQRSHQPARRWQPQPNRGPQGHFNQPHDRKQGNVPNRGLERNSRGNMPQHGHDRR